MITAVAFKLHVVSELGAVRVKLTVTVAGIGTNGDGIIEQVDKSIAEPAGQETVAGSWLPDESCNITHNACPG
jgi:hypothetical protein